MAKKTKEPRRTKSRRSAKRVTVIRVPIRASQGEIEDVERAIAEKLRMRATDMFKKNDKVIIECEHIDWAKHPRGA